MSKLRVGLAGIGMMGRNHARVLSSLPGVELAGVAESDLEKEPVFGVPIVSSVTELIEIGIDYAVIALPTAYHESAALEFCDAGIPVLIEKPLAHDYASARRVNDAFESAGVLGGVGHIERYNPALQQARSRIEQGELGELYQVASRRQGPFPARVADVGVVKDLGTHDLDATMWLTGQQYTSVTGQVTRRSGRDHEDLVAVVGTLSHGAVANHLVNWLSPIKERTLVITGDRGAFMIDTLRADLTFYSNGAVLTQWATVAQFRGVSEGDVTRYAFERPEPLRTEHEAFRDAVLGLESDIVSLREGLQTMKVADAILRSAGLGNSVELSG